MIQSYQKTREISLIGDPTETALVEFAYKKNYEKNILETEYPREAEIPFDSDRKLMSTINKNQEGYFFIPKVHQMYC